MMHDANSRRDFIRRTAAVLAVACPSVGHAQIQPEVLTHWVELPPQSELWGVVAFLGETFVEVTIGSGHEPKVFKGRFEGTRLADFSWPNETKATVRVGIRAKAVPDGRELPRANVEYNNSLIGTENLLVTFGRRGVPADARDRIGSYPFEVAVVGFVGFSR